LFHFTERNDGTKRTQLTRCVDRQVVGLADEFPVVFHQVELVAGVELETTHSAGETVQVVDELLSAPDDLSRRQFAAAAGAPRRVSATHSRLGDTTTFHGSTGY